MSEKYINSRAIAILLATYNGERYLEQQLESIIQQSFTDWTLYIRDDCSNDLTKTILWKYTNSYKNIILIEDNHGNLGAKDSFLYLLSIITSKYYMFADQDDFWLIDKVLLSYNKIKEIEILNPNLPILIHTDVSIVDDKLKIIESSYWSGLNIRPEDYYSYNLLSVFSFIIGMTMLFNDVSKQYIYPVHRNAGMHDSWIAPIIARHGIIKPIYNTTCLYRQHNYNVCGIHSLKDRTLFSKIKNLRHYCEENREKAIRLQMIGFGHPIKYVIFKIYVYYKRLILR